MNNVKPALYFISVLYFLIHVLSIIHSFFLPHIQSMYSKDQNLSAILPVVSLLLCLLFKKSNKLFTLKLFYNLSHNLLKLDMLFGDEFDSNLIL